MYVISAWRTSGERIWLTTATTLKDAEALVELVASHHEYDEDLIVAEYVAFAKQAGVV